MGYIKTQEVLLILLQFNFVLKELNVPQAIAVVALIHGCSGTVIGAQNQFRRVEIFGWIQAEVKSSSRFEVFRVVVYQINFSVSFAVDDAHPDQVEVASKVVGNQVFISIGIHCIITTGVACFARGVKNRIVIVRYPVIRPKTREVELIGKNIFARLVFNCVCPTQTRFKQTSFSSFHHGFQTLVQKWAFGLHAHYAVKSVGAIKSRGGTYNQGDTVHIQL